MPNTNPLKKLVVLSLFAMLGAHSSAPAADQPVLRTNVASPVEIIRISPSQGDLGRIERKRKQDGIQSTNETQVHVVKLYVNMPRPAAQACILYIGEERISEYGGFSEGIFFKVYDPKQFETWQGKPIRMRYRNEMIDLEVTMPPKPEKTPAKRPPLADVLKNEDSR
ncbi:MAG: hypothetical protein KA236_03945 [Verrucomicrobia bacterium]|nr:hypothetical protein [Verrucomicrobiota bacterium]